MTKFEKIVVSAYTGILMCDFSDLHEYVERILERPVYTHEFVSEEVTNEIKQKSKPDFIKICERCD